jgi:hypothetical protein
MQLIVIPIYTFVDKAHTSSAPIETWNRLAVVGAHSRTLATCCDETTGRLALDALWFRLN